jgi:hypothetical protein
LKTSAILLFLLQCFEKAGLFMMLWRTIALLAFPAFVRSHSHHAHNQESFSQERLDELEMKWGTDVSTLQILVEIVIDQYSGASLASQPSHIYHTRVA